MENKKSFSYTLVYFVIALSFFKVPYLMIEFNWINELYFGLQFVTFFAFLLFNLKEQKLNKGIILILIYLAFNSVVSYGKTNFSTIISSFISIFGLCLVVNDSNRKTFYNFIKGFKYALLILLLINLITMFLYPNGLYYNMGNNSSQNWFLGYKNSFILYIYPLIVFSYLDTMIFKNKKLSKFDIFSFFIAFVTVLKGKSSTSLVGLFVVLMSILIPRLFKNTKIFNAMNYLYTYISMFFAIVVLRLQNIFSFLIEDILHKDLTFTGRTYIWDYALKNISNNWLFGYGDKNFSFILSTGTAVRSAHNQILQNVYNYGIISLIIFFVILFIAMIKLKKEKDNQISKFVALCIFMWFIMMITESYDMQYFLYLIVIAFNIKNIINLKEGVLNEK